MWKYRRCEMADADGVVLRHPVQALAAMVLIPMQALLVGLMAKILCEWWMIREIQPWIRLDDVEALLVLSVVLCWVSYGKHRLRIHWFWIELVTVGLAIAVCLGAIPIFH
jgi:hypothetical protein